MAMSTDKKKIEELLTRGVEEIIDRDHLKKRLESGKQLRVKFGIDPTGSDMHIGHAVPLLKLREFQDLGHQVILLIGDYTATIGDPSGRNETRPLLKHEDIQKNMKTYTKQAAKILDMSTVELRYNSEWYGRPNFMKLLMELTGKISLNQILARRDFKKRTREGHDIRYQEALYPVFQGYDSVELESDVELGGTDQKFNLLMGRTVQKRYEKAEQDIITTPIIEGVDGTKKMSKTYGNYIGLLDEPEDMYGKTMSIPDKLILRYFTLTTRISLEQIRTFEKNMKQGKNPRDIKMKLAYEVVRMYHGEKKASAAQQKFVETFSKRETPDEMPVLASKSLNIVDVLIEAEFAKSKGEARRAIDGGGVRINEKKVESHDVEVSSGDVVNKGKRHFVRIK